MQPPTDFFGRPIIESSKSGVLSFGAFRDVGYSCALRTLNRQWLVVGLLPIYP